MGRPMMRFKKTEMRNALSLANEFGYNVRLTRDGDVLFEAIHAGKKPRSTSAQQSIEDFLDGDD